MSGPLRRTAALSDGRVIVIEVAPSGYAIEMWFDGKEGAKLEMTADAALTIGIALQHAAVAVGQREARRRDQKTAARERQDLRRRLLEAAVRSKEDERG